MTTEGADFLKAMKTSTAETSPVVLDAKETKAPSAPVVAEAKDKPKTLEAEFDAAWEERKAKLGIKEAGGGSKGASLVATNTPAPVANKDEVALAK